MSLLSPFLSLEGSCAGGLIRFAFGQSRPASRFNLYVGFDTRGLIILATEELDAPLQPFSLTIFLH